MIVNRAAEMATDRALGLTGLDKSKNTDFAIIMFNVINTEFRKVNKAIYSHK